MSPLHRCQFDGCQRSGKERAISYYQRPGSLLTLHPSLCDEHFKDLPKVDGIATRWLNRLRIRTNGPLSS
jgi:hypothetical protein